MERMNCTTCDQCCIVIYPDAQFKISYGRFDFCSWGCNIDYFKGVKYEEDNNSKGEAKVQTKANTKSS